MSSSRTNEAKYVVGGVVLERPFKARRLGHFALWHSELDSARRFYVDLLGFRSTDYGYDDGGKPILMFTSHGTDHHSFVAIDPATATGVRRKYFEDGNKVNQISFQVGTLEEVAKAHAYFTERNVPISRIGRDFPGSNWALYVFDPDGHRIEFYYGMEQIGWDRRSKPKGAQTPLPYEVPTLPQPAEVTEILTAERRGADIANGYRPDEPLPFDFDLGGIRMQRPFKVSKVGPVCLFVADLDKSEDFYINLLGLKKTEEVTCRGHRVVFLRVGTDHHTVVLMPAALREVLGIGQKTTLLSFAVEMGSYSQLKDAIAFLRQKGVRFVDTIPAELHTGIEFAAYAVADDGHLIQLYFGMEQIGWDGKPRPAASRRKFAQPWPETIEETSDTFVDLTIQGPMA